MTLQHREDVVASRSATRCAVLADVDSRDDARIEALRDACTDAEDALRLGTRHRGGQQVLRIRGLRLPQALAAVPRASRIRLVEATLGRLVDEGYVAVLARRTGNT